MATICFYQDSRHDTPLYWFQDVLQAGYIAKRNDSITELRINGFKTVQTILNQLQPYIRFKTLQVQAVIQACQLLDVKPSKLSENELKQIVDLVLIIQNENYSAHRKKSKQDFYTVLGLTP